MNAIARAAAADRLRSLVLDSPVGALAPWLRAAVDGMRAAWARVLDSLKGRYA